MAQFFEWVLRFGEELMRGITRLAVGDAAASVLLGIVVWAMTEFCLRLLFGRQLQRAWDTYGRAAGLLLRCMRLEAEIAQLAGHDGEAQRFAAAADIDLDGLADIMSARLRAVLEAVDGEPAGDPRGAAASSGAALVAGRVAFAHDQW